MSTPQHPLEEPPTDSRWEARKEHVPRPATSRREGTRLPSQNRVRSAPPPSRRLATQDGSFSIGRSKRSVESGTTKRGNWLQHQRCQNTSMLGEKSPELDRPPHRRRPVAVPYDRAPANGVGHPFQSVANGLSIRAAQSFPTVI